jgi:hypothetical protein
MIGGITDIVGKDSIKTYLRIRLPAESKMQDTGFISVQENTLKIDKKGYNFDNIGDTTSTQEVILKINNAETASLRSGW